MSLRDAVLCAPNLSELNILDKALAATINVRRDEIIQYYIDNKLEIAFLIEAKVGKRKTKVVGRAIPKWLGKEYMTCTGVSPHNIAGKKLRVPKAWATDTISEAQETGPSDDEDELPEEDSETKSAMGGMTWE